MRDQIVIFERCDLIENSTYLREEAEYRGLPARETPDGGFAILDWRLLRQKLPAGAKPLAIIDKPDYIFISGQYFTADEVRNFADYLGGNKE